MEGQGKIEVGSTLGKRFKVVQELEKSEYVEIFKAVDKESGVDVAIKVVTKGGGASNLKNEYLALEKLENIQGFPKVFKRGTHGEKSYLVMELLPRSLYRIFRANDFQMEMKDVLLVVDQLLTRLEALHDLGMVHGNLKPGHIMMTAKGTVHLIDLSLATNYGGWGVSKNHGSFAVPLRYMSIRGHEGLPRKPRDDLESLAYVLALWLRKENLPWLDEKKEDKAYKGKKAIRGKELFDGLPEEFATFYDEIRSLKDDERPNYKKWHGMFRRYGRSIDIAFDHDWPFFTMKRKRKF